MKILTFDAYNYTVGYLEPTITYDTEGNGTVTGFTTRGDIKCAIGNTLSATSLQLISKEQLNVGWTVNNIRDASGNVIWYADNEQSDTAKWDIISVIPRLNFYGYAEGYIHVLNKFIAGRVRP